MALNPSPFADPGGPYDEPHEIIDGVDNPVDPDVGRVAIANKQSEYIMATQRRVVAAEEAIEGLAVGSGLQGPQGPIGPQGNPGLVQSVNGKSAASITLNPEDIGALDPANNLSELLNAAAALVHLGVAKVYIPEVGYGAAGDGVADDTAAINACATAAALTGGTVWLAKTYRTTGMLYFHGPVDFSGGGTLLLDGVLPVHSTDEYWVFLGLKSDGTADTWSGTISGLTFKTTANASKTDFLTMMDPWNVAGGTIEKNVFDCTASVAGKVGGIRCQANSGFYSAAFSVADLKIDKNRLVAAQNDAGNEGISASGSGGSATDVRITNNRVWGFGDDAIAVHGVVGFTISWNRCYSIDGRIAMDGAQYGSVTGNHIERIPTQDGTGLWKNGSGLIGTLVSGASLPAPKHISITGNTLKFGLAVTPEAAFKLSGGHAISIAGNTVYNPVGAAANFPAGWSSSAVTGWTDADGLDPAGTVIVRDVKFSDNVYSAAAPMGVSGAGGVNSVNVTHDLPTHVETRATAPGSINAGAANTFRYTLTGNWTATAVINGALDQVISISFIQDATGGRTYVWPGSTYCVYAGGTPPTPSTGAGYEDSVTFRHDGTVFREISRSIGVH